MNYELHPLCTLFPRLAGAEFEALCADIRAHGLQQPIVLHDGMVLDGGNRYRACIETGVEPVCTQFSGPSVVAFVLSANLHRRHLGPGQQAAIVASAQDWAKAQVQGANRHTIKTGNVAGLETVAQRAAQSGAGERTQRMADKVAKADPELAKQVAHGTVSLPKALATVTAPKAAAPSPAAHPPVAKDDPNGLTQEEMDAAAADFDPLAELESLHHQLTAAQAELAAVHADDPAAEALKWRRQAEQANRSRDEAMQVSKGSHDREQYAMKQLRRCGAAVGEDDPRRIALAVEKLAARVKAEAA